MLRQDGYGALLGAFARRRALTCICAYLQGVIQGLAFIILTTAPISICIDAQLDEDLANVRETTGTCLSTRMRQRAL